MAVKGVLAAIWQAELYRQLVLQMHVAAVESDRPDTACGGQEVSSVHRVAPIRRKREAICAAAGPG